MTFAPRPYLLTNKIQHYEWGERGPSAYIARLLGLQSVATDTPFAELWMGTHPLGASTMETAPGLQLPLSELVRDHPAEVLGRRVAAAFGDQFPFLLKVLSAGEPLSIQLHPSKEQAAVLHGKDPGHYPDANHKPEIAVALESLDALAGLRDIAEIRALFETYPALRDFVGFESFSDAPEAQQPRLAFLALLRNSVEQPERLGSVIETLTRQLEHKNGPDLREKLFRELPAKYPGDVGLLSIFFLNLRVLEKGQAMFIPAGVPHAYLKGNIIECMASSDNVIRAGLTPKFKDIPALMEVVNDRQPVIYPSDGAGGVYTPPVSEFRVSRRELRAGDSFADQNDGVRIILVLRGRLRLAWPGGALEAGQGRSVLAPGCLGEMGVECLESSELYTADVP